MKEVVAAPDGAALIFGTVTSTGGGLIVEVGATSTGGGLVVEIGVTSTGGGLVVEVGDEIGTMGDDGNGMMEGDGATGALLGDLVMIFGVPIVKGGSVGGRVAMTPLVRMGACVMLWLGTIVVGDTSTVGLGVDGGMEQAKTSTFTNAVLLQSSVTSPQSDSLTAGHTVYLEDIMSPRNGYTKGIYRSDPNVRSATALAET